MIVNSKDQQTFSVKDQTVKFQLGGPRGLCCSHSALFIVVQKQP